MIVTAEQAAQMAGEAIAQGHVFIAYPMGGERGYSVYREPVVQGGTFHPERQLVIRGYRGETQVLFEPGLKGLKG